MDYSLNVVSGYDNQDILFFLLKGYGDNYKATVDTISDSCQKIFKIATIVDFRKSIGNPIYLFLYDQGVIKSVFPSKTVPNLPVTHQPTTSFIPSWTPITISSSLT